MIASRRLIFVAALAGLCVASVLPGRPVLAEDGTGETQETSPDEQLMAAWWETAAMIGYAEPWSACRDHLAAAIDRCPDAKAKLIEACRTLADDLALAIRREATSQPTAQSDDLGALVRSLHRSRIEHWLVSSPIRYINGVYAWDYVLLQQDPQGSDPACRLFKLGRPAIPALIETLEDRTPSRCVQANPEYGVAPRVARVGDLALALIEGIASCQLNGIPGEDLFISYQKPDERAALIDRIRRWWDATHDMTPTDAVVWTIKHNPPTLRDGMIDALITRGDREAAIHCLLELYIANDDLNPQMAPRLVRAGSRAPLEFVHRVADDGRPLTRNMVRMVADHGNTDDCKLLCQYIADEAGPGDRRADRQVEQVVDILRYSDLVQTIPVHVAVLTRHVEAFADVDPPRVPIPRYVDQAANRVQTLCGVAFGYHSDDGAEHCFRVICRMLDWWNQEGCAVFGLEQSRPHGPSGIH